MLLYFVTCTRRIIQKEDMIFEHFYFVQIFEACLLSLITSAISFGLPLLRKCSACPDPDTNPGIECPRPPGIDGNFVNVRSLSHTYLNFCFSNFLL